MLVYKKVKIAIFVFLFFMTCDAKACFMAASQFSGEDVACCAVACRRAQYSESDGDKSMVRTLPLMAEWNKAYSLLPPDPNVERLVFNSKIAEGFLGGEESNSAIFIPKDRRVIIAFPGGKLLGSLDEWKSRNSQHMDLSLDGTAWHGYNREGVKKGMGHRGSLQLWQAVRDSLLGGGNKLRNYVQGLNLASGKQGPDGVTFKDCQFVLTGHGLGGMAAQWAALDIINTLYGGKNDDNNVVAVTFGAPRVFCGESAQLWDIKMGGADKHLRVVGEKDGFVSHYSATNFNGFTGTERRLPQKAISNLQYGFLAAGKVIQGKGWETSVDYWEHGGAYHTLGKYEEAAALSASLSLKEIEKAWEKFGSNGEQNAVLETSG